MAFDRPSLRELISQMQADAEREAGATQLRQSNLRVLPKVFAFGVHGLYAYIDWVVKQLFPDSSEKSFLERQASKYSLSFIAAQPAAMAGARPTLGDQRGPHAAAHPGALCRTTAFV